MSSSSIRDNQSRGSVGKFLKKHIKTDAKLSFVTAYFTIYAFEALQNELKNIEYLRLLFGEPRFIRNIDPSKNDFKSFDIEDKTLNISNRLEQNAIAKACADWINEKVTIKSVKKANLLHGKMYHIENKNIEDEALLGSSNFTLGGIGLGKKPNIELNLVVNDRRDRNELKLWFDELWEDKNQLLKDVKQDVLNYLEQLYRDNVPEFVYYKTLFHIFEKFIDEEKRTEILAQQIQFTETVIWGMLYEFQKDAVKGAINKIMNYNGCIIADSVGLGKTFEALAVIKYFELLNYKVLVLCPKKLRANWTVYQAQNNSALNPFIEDRFSYTVLSHSDLSRDTKKKARVMSGDVNLATLNWGNYDLIVIDESHNFRNNTKGKKDEEGNRIRKSRYEKLLEGIIQAGIQTKVLLLSATPVNTNLKDLRNQIYFITAGKDDAFANSMGIPNIKETLRVAQTIFTNWADPKKNPVREVKDLLEKLHAGFFKLLDELTIARSRSHIRRYYQYEMSKIGQFPKRLKPISIYSAIDTEDKFPTYDVLNEEISNYQLSLFNPFKYVVEDLKPFYSQKSLNKKVANFSQNDREHFLIGMMKVNFLKRLESSIQSFAVTLERTIQKIDGLVTRIKKFQKFKKENSNYDFEKLNTQLENGFEEIKIEGFEDEDLHDAFQIGKKLIYNFNDLALDKWLEDLAEDKKRLENLYTMAKKITPKRDKKLQSLKTLIEEKTKNPNTTKDGRANRKVLIFTAFSDTAFYLYKELNEWTSKELKSHIAVIAGGNKNSKTTFGKNEFNQILTNFSPISKKRHKIKSMPQEGEIDILIATDCISEGQNLQDCDYLVNYDIHWNPVRIIQRFGRVDRIGSKNSSIQLVNFWPTPDLNKYIKLKNRVEARMALVDISATAEDNLLAGESKTKKLDINQVKDLIEDDLTYRDKQLLRLKDEVLDLEDFNESVTLSELTLDDFRIELLKYIEANREKLKNAPLGLFAVVPPNPKYNSIQQGIIFCLRQKENIQGNQQINPLKPYFLVYITLDGVVKYNFTHPKQILDIFRLLCSEKNKAYDALCRLFEQKTDYGNDMSQFTDLLKKAVKAIVQSFKKRDMRNLLSSRGGKLTEKTQRIKELSDFELITWLIILDKEH